MNLRIVVEFLQLPVLRYRAEYVDTILDRAGASGVMYLGDMDPKGILIPAMVDRARGEAGLPRVMPAIPLYSRLLTHGVVRPLSGDVSETAREATLEWLGEELGLQVLALWRQGGWIPQESLGAEALATILGKADR